MRVPLILAAMMGAATLSAQVSRPEILWVTANPSGACASLAPTELNYTVNPPTWWGCNSVTGMWVEIAGSGSFTNPMTTTGDMIVGGSGGTPLRLPVTAAGYSVVAFGALCDGSTDDSTAINNAVSAANSAGGGDVTFPAGTCITTGVTIYSNVNYIGQGTGATTIKLKASSNTNVFQGSVAGYAAGVIANYVAAANTGSTSANTNWMIRDLTIDGNNGNESAASYGIIHYGYNFKLINVAIQNTYSDCLYTDFNPTSLPAGAPIEPQIVNFKAYHCGIDSTNTTVKTVGAVGIRWAGPTDAHWTQLVVFQNAAENVMIGPRGGSVQIENIHLWGPHLGVNAPNMVMEAGANTCSNCEFEGSDTAQLALLAGENVISGRIFQPTTQMNASTGIQIGQTAGGTTFPGVYYQATPGNPTPGNTDSSAASSNGDVLVFRIFNTYTAGVSFTNEARGKYIFSIDLSNTGTGVYTSGTPASSSEYDIKVTGLTCASGSLATCGGSFHGATTRLNASTTGNSSANIPSGSAPTSPITGDFWNASGLLQFYDGTATRTLQYGAGAAGAIAPICSLPSPVCFRITEDFPSSISNGGTQGFFSRQIVGTTSSFTNLNGTATNPGLVRLTTQAVAGDGISGAMDNSGAGMVSGIFQLPYTFEIIARVNQTSNQSFRYGLYTPATTTTIPTTGEYIRFDDQLKNISSATCNDAGNKCGLTTLTCTATQTVTFTFTGGTATGSVACTGTNAIANTTAVTVTSAGKGYNSTGGAAVGVPTGGTATVTGSLALTTTLGAAASGGDTDFMECITNSSNEVCVDTTVAADTNFHHALFREISTGHQGVTFLNNVGAVQLAEQTFCSSGCNGTASLTGNALAPGIIIVDSAGAAITADIDYIDFAMTVTR